jgi:hypothetical protein
VRFCVLDIAGNTTQYFRLLILGQLNPFLTLYFTNTVTGWITILYSWKYPSNQKFKLLSSANNIGETTTFIDITERLPSNVNSGDLFFTKFVIRQMLFPLFFRYSSFLFSPSGFPLDNLSYLRIERERTKTKPIVTILFTP